MQFIVFTPHKINNTSLGLKKNLMLKTDIVSAQDQNLGRR